MWVNANTEVELRTRISSNYDGWHSDYKEVTWTEPGYYYLETVNKYCDRGCCKQYGVKAVPASFRAIELQEEIDKLEQALREARAFANGQELSV